MRATFLPAWSLWAPKRVVQNNAWNRGRRTQVKWKKEKPVVGIKKEKKIIIMTMTKSWRTLMSGILLLFELHHYYLGFIMAVTTVLKLFKESILPRYPFTCTSAGRSVPKDISAATGIWTLYIVVHSPTTYPLDHNTSTQHHYGDDMTMMNILGITKN